MTGRIERSNRGASLVIVLIIMTVFGLVLGVILEVSSANVRAQGAFRDQRQRVFGAQGAVDGEINFLRGDRTRGRFGAPCPSFTTAGAAGTITVTCTPQPGSGLPLQQPTQPGYALLTTAGLSGYPSGAGISVGGGNNALKVDGSVYSNSTIDTPKGLDAGDDPVGAFGACTGTIVGVPVTCNTGTNVADPGGAATVEPPPGSAWGSVVQSLPATAPAPTCNAQSRVATMVPGSYFDLAAMNAGIGACTVVWLQPGAYYFDFAYGNASNVTWSISKTVVGGTPSGWNPNASSAQSPAVPGACDRAQPGVQLVFGHDSRIGMDAGAIELCPPLTTATQAIALYGRKTDGPAAAPTVTTLLPAGQSAPITGSGTPFAPGLVRIDNLVNTGNVNGRNRTGGVTLTGFNGAALSGATISGVQLRVAHREVQNPANAINTIQAVVTGTGASCTVNLTKRATLGTDTVAVPCLTTAAQLANVSVEFRVRTVNSGNPAVQMDLDGIELDVTSTGPRLRKQVAGTTLLDMSPGGGNRGRIHIWGSVYAPLSVINLDFKNNSEAAFQRGAVINRFTGSNVPPSQTFAAFSLPGPNAFTNRVVELVARRGTDRLLRAVVEYDDAAPTPGQTVRVLTWNAVN